VIDAAEMPSTTGTGSSPAPPSVRTAGPTSPTPPNSSNTSSPSGDAGSKAQDSTAASASNSASDWHGQSNDGSHTGHVVDLHVQLDETVGAKLRKRAARLGVKPETLVGQAVEELLATDPFEVVTRSTIY
jgi:hypothetical protein